MMSWRPPLSWRLTGIILVTVMAVLGVAVWVLGTAEIATLRAGLVREASIKARLIGDYSASDMAFDAPDESRKTLERLADDQGLQSVALYRSDGTRFAHWARDGAGKPTETIATEPVEDLREEEDSFRVEHLIVRDDHVYGRIRLVESKAVLHQRIREYWTTVAAVGVGLFALALLFAAVLQRAVSRPISSFTRVAERIAASNDYSVRVEAPETPEFATLAGGLNEMLATVQRHQNEADEALERQRRYADRLTLLHDIDGAILAEWPRERIAAAALQGLRGHVPFQWAAVCGFDEALERATVLLRWPVEGVGAAPTGFALEDLSDFVEAERKGEIVVAPAGLPSNDWRAALRKALGVPDSAGLEVLPLYTENVLLGCLALVEPGPADHAERMVVAYEVAELVALALYQARLREQIERHTEELEQRVAERTAQLEARNGELEAFGYSVAHDLRAPLSAMEGYASALEEDYGASLDEMALTYLSRIKDASTRMDRLIRDLLDYSRMSMEEIELHPIDAREVVGDVLAQLRGYLDEREARVTVGHLGPIVAHEATLAQALTNLVTNAVKFVPRGEKPDIWIGATNRNGRLRLEVSDNGIGIAPEHKERIFRIFERLHARSEYPGTGIGLAIVAKAVQRMRGRVGVESETGSGSKFWIELPKAG